MDRIWIIPISLFLISITLGICANILALSRGATLWDASIIALSASVFFLAGYLIGRAERK